MKYTIFIALMLTPVVCYAQPVQRIFKEQIEDDAIFQGEEFHGEITDATVSNATGYFDSDKTELIFNQLWLKFQEFVLLNGGFVGDTTISDVSNLFTEKNLEWILQYLASQRPYLFYASGDISVASTGTSVTYEVSIPDIGTEITEQLNALNLTPSAIVKGTSRWTLAQETNTVRHYLTENSRVPREDLKRLYPVVFRIGGSDYDEDIVIGPGNKLNADGWLEVHLDGSQWSAGTEVTLHYATYAVSDIVESTTSNIIAMSIHDRPTEWPYGWLLDDNTAGLPIGATSDIDWYTYQLTALSASAIASITPTSGEIYWNLTDERAQYWNGNRWLALIDGYSNSTAGILATVSPGLIVWDESESGGFISDGTSWFQLWLGYKGSTVALIPAEPIWDDTYELIYFYDPVTVQTYAAIAGEI